ncbi:MAG: hypothetical protein BWY95_00223 [Bacteroidetes bacterium ADurb.BinA104]|jgi:hypothetical protein|nr:MAG: hypothetical protein BWY95_00223 [Bacteroidetes bacterium ADurb.BinA104]HQB97523.1 hypothetical protein [Candidatus Cloacimonadota bacterium]
MRSSKQEGNRLAKASVISREELVPQDCLDAVGKLQKDIETKFIEIGELFSHIKAAKLFKFRSYESFKDWVETEQHISHKTANKLIRMHRLYVEELDIDEETLKAIGFDRLLMIAPMMEKADWEIRDQLMEMAAEQPLPQFYESLKKMKGEAKAEQLPLDLKKVLVEQWKEQMCNLFDCSWSEAQYKLALWFSSGDRADAEVMKLLKQEVKKAQAKFEREASDANR